jgi:hypothetical protein
MNKKFILLILASLLSSCASIVSKSNYDVSVTSSPSEAKFSITKSDGVVVHSGRTPAIVSLASGNGYFSKAHYVFKFEKNGYETKTHTLSPSINGWYWGNILFGVGGLIGLLIVDPITGAMYKLPGNTNVSLDINSRASNEIKIISLDDLSQSQKSQLIRVN